MDLDFIVPPIQMTHANSVAPFEWVPVTVDPEGSPVEEKDRFHMVIDVIHDGWVVPQQYLDTSHETSDLDHDELHQAFVHERDWGASLVAGCLASALGLDGFGRVTTARALLDFGRFPGSTGPSADHMGRYAINYPFSKYLSYAQKKRLLEEHYDAISKRMEATIRGRILKIGVHTYDERNPTQTRRPAVSLLTRAHGHQRDFEMPQGLFDPMFPDVLLEYTSDRLLRARIALTLEEHGIYVADNYPYALPEGSVEVRSQVWYFFEYVRREYERLFPQAPHQCKDPRSPRNRVWSMLLDTNLRSTDSDVLRGYLHMYRRAPVGYEATFERAQNEYGRIREFVEREKGRLIQSYRSAQDRTSSLGLEVRKDLVWNFKDGEPIGPRVQDAQFIARIIAQSIRTYLMEDRDEKFEAKAHEDPRFH